MDCFKGLSKESWGKTLLMSTIGNTISGLAGIYLMPWLMLFWHLIADNFMLHATFDIINWYCTFILMCLGSVVLEVRGCIINHGATFFIL